MDIGIFISIGILLFSAGIQWGILLTKQKHNEEKFKTIFSKIDQWEDDAIEFYKEKSREKNQ